MSYTGNATYYCLCFNGSCDNHTGGACGYCYDNEYDLAYPNTNGMDDSCGLLSKLPRDLV